MKNEKCPDCFDTGCRCGGIGLDCHGCCSCNAGYKAQQPIKYLFIEIEIYEGDRVHNHRVLHTTNGNNIMFAANRYVSTYWGYGDRDGEYWWFHGEIIGKLVKVKELTKDQFDVLNDVFYN